METKVDIPYETDENKLIETLRGICLPAVRCLNRLSKEEKRRYAPYLIGGKDALIKLSILLYQNLFTPEVIEKLIESGEDLCRTYLVNSQNCGCGRTLTWPNSNGRLSMRIMKS